KVFRGQRPNVIGSRERIDHPAGRLAIVNADNCLPFDGDLDVHLQGTLELHRKGAFHAMREGDTAGDSFGLDGLKLVNSPASVERFLDDFVGGLSSRGQWQEQE